MPCIVRQMTDDEAIIAMMDDKKKEDRNVIITGAELEKYFVLEAESDDMKDQILHEGRVLLCYH